MWLSIVNAVWKQQNGFGKFQTLLITLLFCLIMYYRTMYGVYKHKEVQRLKDKKTALTEKVTELLKKRIANNRQTKIITQSYKAEAQKIEKKRKEDEKTINHSTVTDKQRNDFVSRYENR